MTKLRGLESYPLNVSLNEPFGIATGVQTVAENIVVQLTLEDGTLGLGEAAPVTHISGETRADALAALSLLPEALSGTDVRDYRRVSSIAAEVLVSVPSALAGVEMALLDALTRRAGLSLRSFFGGRESELTTDVTIPTGSLEQATIAAEKRHVAGFRQLKVKVGAGDVDADVQRLVGIMRAAPHATLVLDGNTGFTPGEALLLLRELGKLSGRIVLFEQPVARDDFEGLAEVEAKSGIPVAADESLRTMRDFRRIISVGGISVINIKTAKLGIVGAWDLLVAAHAAGLRTMIGGMVETEISMTVSACLAAGVGGVAFVDLDTPLFLLDSPVRGRVATWGPSLDLSSIGKGHSVDMKMELNGGTV